MKTKAFSTPKLPQRLSLVAQTVESLYEGIRNGHWQKHLPGERELCESLQVSRRTLRPALEELQRKGWLEVSGRQRRRIKSRSSSKVENARKKTIGILMPGSFLSLPSRISFVMDTLRAKLTAAGCVVQFHINPACYTANPGRVLAQFVAEHPGMIWIVLSAQEPMQRWFSRQKLTCLILGSSAPGISMPSVDVDFHATCHHAGGLLWRKGHRRIALVLHKGIYGGDIASEEGLRDALKGMPGAHIQVLRHDTTTSHLCILIDECLRLPNPPTAYLVGGATHALTVAMHLMRRGRRIPKDVTVLSRDNDPILDAASPTIARYAIQPAQFASRVALAVRQLAETSTVPADAIRLMPAFVSGESI
ncbi:substrate-binding domain-containing protein [Prosthecobacter sp.]|uniref:substrate-binding domain-containing protein n=1 Tax=Prosthecobacter sp. TaxID=1965333 RepID=UPI002ABBCA60|nr:substrate-binding domain-containing protein [Prosthecobacter sp.]MDZ4403268.1 substrate-binding domain-containing protein [Prosthecobacter sp.]